MNLQPKPPVARRDEVVLELHGRRRVDPYYWLRDRESDEVKSHLEAENDYFDSYLDANKELVETIFQELKDRIAVDDASVPVVHGDFGYSVRYAKGGAFETYWRAPVREGKVVGEAKLILDVNRLAEDRSFVQVGSLSPSPDGNWLAYTLDEVGRRLYSLRLLNLETGEDFAEGPVGLAESVVWSASGQEILLLGRDSETLRARDVLLHRVGQTPGEAQRLYREEDVTFSLGLRRSKSREFALIHCHQTLKSEVRALPLDLSTLQPLVLHSRENRHEYSADHAAGRFFLRINDRGRNFRLVSFQTSEALSGPTDEGGGWVEEVGHRDDVLLEDFEVLRAALVTVERRDALSRIKVRPSEGVPFELAIDEPVYGLHLQGNNELDTDTLRYAVGSPRTPQEVIDADVVTGKRLIRKRQPVGGDFDASLYETERLDVERPDGALVPVSLVYRKGLVRDGSAPALLSGYGAYGVCVDPLFRASVLSLLDRGFVFATAHVRGGMERGYGWYENGRQLSKKNTFSDFIAVGDHLVTAGYTSKDRLVARGGSAGGLLMGVVVNERPDLFAAVAASVPFVDVVTTMLDEDVPLTTGEYDEWGDPRDLEFYDYISSYSPYDNVSAQEVPDLLVTTGFHDSQVQYWEPAKWVAKLRAMKLGDSLLFMRTNFDAGHGGASGRLDYLRELAIEWAFVVDRAGASARSA